MPSESTVDTLSLDHEQRFRRLGELLRQWQPVWRPLPFQHAVLPWEASHPHLARAVRALTDAQTEQLQQIPLADSPLAEWLPVAELAALTAVPELVSPTTPTLPDAWGVFVGGRKWQQIQAFAPLVPAAANEDQDTRLVEWCAGKGHLSRGLARWQGRSVDALEWQSALCESGRELAERQAAPVLLHHQDVMAASAASWLTPETHAMALHACGDLHTRLLALAARQGNAVTLAPCCYQRTSALDYLPLSRQGRDEMTWDLSRDDLAMAVQETVTAPRKVRRERRLANAWRLGFDGLQRQVSGRDAYLPVPSLAYGLLPASFADFCEWAAQQKGIALPAGIDWAAHEAAGWQRLEEVNRLEVVRYVFRRPLETWLVLDRVRFMEESGFHVRLGTFCERSLTPRNLVIQAERSWQSPTLSWQRKAG